MFQFVSYSVMVVSQVPILSIQRSTSEHLVMKDPHTDRLVAITAQIFHCLYQALMFWYAKRTSTALAQILCPL